MNDFTITRLRSIWSYKTTDIHKVTGNLAGIVRFSGTIEGNTKTISVERDVITGEFLSGDASAARDFTKIHLIADYTAPNMPALYHKASNDFFHNRPFNKFGPLPFQGLLLHGLFFTSWDEITQSGTLSVDYYDYDKT
ncbi:hypothetical protein Xoosp13_356 [Xanthomonas phage Xoo-sp13]|nr:hypothetical protein Xoosp13_356 [Xanthomonas phage Xoo-sp13]